MSDLTKQQIKKYKTDRARLFKGSKNSMYVHEDVLTPIIMQSRLSDPKAIKFRSDLGFKQIILILKKEQSVVIPLLKALSAEKIKLQHKALKNERLKTDMYFSLLQKLTKKDIQAGIKMTKTKEKQKQKNILTPNFFTGLILMQKVLIFLEISKIQNYITQSNKAKIRKRKRSQNKKNKKQTKKNQKLK